MKHPLIINPFTAAFLPTGYGLGNDYKLQSLLQGKTTQHHMAVHVHPLILKPVLLTKKEKSF